jgi:hypothetical protein
MPQFMQPIIIDREIDVEAARKTRAIIDKAKPC